MRKFVTISIILLLSYCSIGEDKMAEVKILNDVFLLVVDTIAYKENSLRPPPPSISNVVDTADDKKRNILTTNNTESGLFLIMNNALIDLSKWKKELEIFFEQHKELALYKDIVNRRIFNDPKELWIDVSDITNRGRYKLIPINKKRISNIKAVGQVTFSRVAYNKDLTKAVIVATISQGEKAGVTKLVLLTKQKKWLIEREEILEIW